MSKNKKKKLKKKAKKQQQLLQQSLNQIEQTEREGKPLINPSLDGQVRCFRKKHFYLYYIKTLSAYYK